MAQLFRLLRTTVQQLRLVETGAAAVEFALILPIMLTLYIGANEASALIILYRKVQTTAGSLGDMVAQANKSITKTEMTNYFRAATAIINPYPVSGLMQVVTAVSVDSSGKAVVSWSKQYSNGTYAEGPYSKGSSFTLPTAMTDISRNDSVIVSEARSSYLPFYGIVFNNPIALFRRNFYLPRFDGAITEPK